VWLEGRTLLRLLDGFFNTQQQQQQTQSQQQQQAGQLMWT
jgi:hypothetical protein